MKGEPGHPGPRGDKGDEADGDIGEQDFIKFKLLLKKLDLIKTSGKCCYNYKH